MNKETKEALNNIVELIEDDRFPARRNITDYVVLLFPLNEQKEADEYIDLLYEKHDSNKKKP